MYGAVNKNGCGLGVVLMTPGKEQIPLAKKLEFRVTNNMAEYEACIFGLQAVMALGWAWFYSA